MSDTGLEISSSLYWWWWSRGSCSWCNLACCGNLTRVWKWVTLRTLVCLTKQLDSASDGLGIRFAGIETNGTKLALRDSEIYCGQPNKMHSNVFGPFDATQAPAHAPREPKKGCRLPNAPLADAGSADAGPSKEVPHDCSAYNPSLTLLPTSYPASVNVFFLHACFPVHVYVFPLFWGFCLPMHVTVSALSKCCLTYSMLIFFFKNTVNGCNVPNIFAALKV
jgi:hypothetical protein